MYTDSRDNLEIISLFESSKSLVEDKHTPKKQIRSQNSPSVPSPLRVSLGKHDQDPKNIEIQEESQNGDQGSNLPNGTIQTTSSWVITEDTTETKFAEEKRSCVVCRLKITRLT